MPKAKPYLDADETRSRMFSNITEMLSLPSPSPLGDTLSQKCYALISFYGSPPPHGMQYHWNHLWVMCCEFNQLYTRLQKLLFSDIEAAKQPTTRLKRKVEAVELAVSIWEKGHHFDEKNGLAIIVPIPPPPSPQTPEQVARIRASVQATWARGSRDS